MAIDARLRPMIRGALDAESKQQWDQAAWLYGVALQLAPQDHRLHTNLGNVFWLADQPDRAVSCFERAVGLAPDQALPYRGLGNALRDLNAFERAAEAYEQALRHDPAPLTAWNLSQTLIGLERYGEAYARAEERLAIPEMLAYRDPPYWHGSGAHQDLAAQGQLRLWSEQGFGDTLQYLRWVAPLCHRPNQLCLEVEWQLVAVVQHGLAWLPYPPLVVAKDRAGAAPDPISDPQGPLMSLAHHCGGAPLIDVWSGGEGEIAGPGRLGYLHSDHWPRRAPTQQPRVGLVWAAGRKLDDPFSAREYRKRSLPAQALGALLEGLQRQGAELVNLQHGLDRDQADPWLHCWTDHLPEDADFAVTAAWVRQLDLVICVDTAMAHLAGALGHPGWVLLPFSADPRWLRGRSDSVWYPSLRLWRQPSSGNWDAVVDDVLDAFSGWWQQASGC
jgi:tetratricopeptide (TPR) repeat protein